MSRILIIFIFSFLGNNLYSQCLTLQSSKDLDVFFEDIELKKAPKKVENLVTAITSKIFPSPKDTVKVVGYINKNDEHPSAYATSDNLSDDFINSEKVVGKVETGFIWLDYKWMTSIWKKRNYNLQPDVVFLIGHEIAHIVHEKDTQWQRKVELDSLGKPKFDKRGQPIFQIDADGNYIGFFSYIPDELVSNAKEIHADYAGGIILYDLMLFKHDSWLKSEDKGIRKAHQARYDKIVNSVIKMIRKDLAPNCSVSHGSAEDRVNFFLKGINDRRNDLNQFKKLRQKITVMNSPIGIQDLLKKEGQFIKDYVTSDEYKVCPK